MIQVYVLDEDPSKDLVPDVQVYALEVPSEDGHDDALVDLLMEAAHTYEPLVPSEGALTHVLVWIWACSAAKQGLLY